MWSHLKSNLQHGAVIYIPAFQVDRGCRALFKTTDWHSELWDAEGHEECQVHPRKIRLHLLISSEAAFVIGQTLTLRGLSWPWKQQFTQQSWQRFYSVAVLELIIILHTLEMWNFVLIYKMSLQGFIHPHITNVHVFLQYLNRYTMSVSASLPSVKL